MERLLHGSGTRGGLLDQVGGGGDEGKKNYFRKYFTE